MHIVPESLTITSYPIITDPRCTTIEANFGSKAQSRTIFDLDIVWANTDDNIVWQPDVYFHARELAIKVGLRRIVDIGCGSAEKLLYFFNSSESDVHCIDLPTYLPKIKDPNLKFHGCNLSMYDSLEDCFSYFCDDVPTLFIMADVVEHLIDPRPILRKVRQLLRKNPQNRLVLSTPDRLRYNGDLHSVSPNASHVREWELSELVSFISSCGFTIVKQAFTRCSDLDPLKKTCYLECSCSLEFYNNFLKHNDLPPLSGILIITTEHADAERTGGIGTYVKHLQKLLSDLNLVILYVGFDGCPDLKFKQDKNWLCSETFLISTDYSDRGDLVLDTFVQIAFFYDTLRIVEAQDYLGDAYRIAQAKQAGLLPHEIIIKVTGHSTLCYLENSHEAWFHWSELHMLYQERELLELADVVWFPTQFLRTLYDEWGYRISKTAAQVRPYPIFFNKANVKEDFTIVDTLIFLGRRTRAKGYPDAVKLFKKVGDGKLNNEIWKNVSRIIILGENIGQFPEEDAVLGDLSGRFEIEEYYVSHEECLNILERERHRSIALIPYKADNSPCAVYDCIDTCCPFVAYEAGGIPEMIPEKFHKQILCKPNVRGLAKAIETLLDLDAQTRRDLVVELKSTTADKYKIINPELLHWFKHQISPPEPAEAKTSLAEISSSKQILDQLFTSASGENSMPLIDNRLPEGIVTIAVSVFNTKMDYIVDLCRGINNQTLKPREVIFVDDGSEEGYVSELDSILESSLQLPYRVISEPHRGAPAVRNVGWRNATTKYVIFHDSDNIMKPDFTWLAVEYLEKHPDYAAVTCYMEQFHDGEPYDIYNSMAYRYRPKFPSLIIGMHENVFGDTLACCRKESLAVVGGWDDDYQSMWDDWALYMNLVSSGHKIGVINSFQFLYRVRPDSMLRTFPQFQAEFKLAKNFKGIPRFEALSLMRLAVDISRKSEDISRLSDDISRKSEDIHRLTNDNSRLAEANSLLSNDLQILHASLSYKVSQKIIRSLDRVPLLKNFLRRSILTVWNSLKMFLK